MIHTEKQATILVIDDEAAIRNSFTDYLEDMDYNVLTAENGSIGLELIEREKPQMIMVDLRMPEIDGLELLKWSNDIAPDTPKIVISGANQIADVVQALRYGAWDYLVKPVKDLSILGHSVENALEKARLLQENKSYQEHREELIQERTQELEEANQHLSKINHRLKKIVETTKGLSNCIEMSQFGARVLDEFAHHMVATGGSLYFAEKEGLRRMETLDPGHAPDFINFPLAKHSILNQVMETGQPVLIEDMSRKDNIKPSGWDGYRNGSLLAFPIPDNDGKIIGILSLHSKIGPPFIEQDKEIGAILASYCCETLRAVQAFEALQRSERQYKTLFEKTNDAIFVIEKKTGRYIDANEAAVTLTGIPLHELKEMNLSQIAPDSADQWLVQMSQIDNAIDLGEVTFRKPDNSSRIARVSSVPLDERAVVSIARDITHDLEIESQLRQSQKMEAIGTLAGGIAHDFNNILSSIFGYAQLAEMDVNDPEKAKKNIGQVIKGAHRAADLVHQILTFSRKTEHSNNPLKLFTIVKEAIKFLRSSIPVTIEIEDKILSKSTILADQTQAHQVVMNLCTNAYHAMRDSGGKLKIELSDVEITETHPAINNQKPGKYIKLEVEDTGHGIDRETLKRIFDPYFTTKNPDEGTGLGLAVVDGIVKKHNGFIKIMSEVGKGTTFQVFWPVIEKEELQNLADKNNKDLPKGTETILLADDEKDILDTVKPILENQGYKVEAYDNGISAFEAFSACPDKYNIVITDITMPGMTGDDLSINILKIRKNIPIILCTGYSEKLNEENAYEIGISKFIKKPVTSQKLSALIRELLDKNKK